MQKLISTAILLIIGYIVSYLLSLGGHSSNSECKPYLQENSFIKLHWSDDDEKENGERNGKYTTPKESNQNPV